MAGILSRFKDIMSSNINALLDKVEDPMKMIDQYLRNLESDLGKVKAETAAVMAEETKSKRELDECIDSINKMQTSVNGAIGNMSKFDEMEAKINKKLDTANAMAELNNSQKEENIEDLIAKYDNETKNTSSEIDDELSELKSKLGLDK